MKKLMALLLAAIMTSTLFTACGVDDGKSSQESVPSSNNPESSASTYMESSKEEEPNLYADEVALTWVFPAVADSYPGWDEINAKLNEITKERINASINVEMIPLGEYDSKMNMKFTAGEEFDLCFTGAWNPYLPAVSKGAYAELTEDVLSTYAPDVMAELNSVVWDAVRVDGKIYGIPLQQIYVRQTGIRFPTELIEKYNIDVNSVKTLDDIDVIAKIFKDNEPDVVPIFANKNAIYNDAINYLGFDVLINNFIPGAVRYAEETPVVVNQFESEEFRNLCLKIREWNQAGFLPADAVTGADSVAESDVVGVYFDPAFKPGGAITEGQIRGYDITEIPFGDCAMTTSAIQATITAVSATSKNVERAVSFINILDSDPETLNLICHGIEGRDYEFVGDKADKVIKPISEYPGMLSFLIGNVFNEYYTDPLQIGTWEETAEINATAKGSCILGFAFNQESVATQISQCNAIVEEYVPALACGAVDVEENIATLNKALKDAGVEEIIKEMQSQVDAWLAAK